MMSLEDALVSTAQTMLRVRHPNGAIGRAEIAAAADACRRLLGPVSDASRDRVVAAVETRPVLTAGRSTRIVDERGHVPWYVGDRKTGRRFFQRYCEFLRLDQGWPQAAIDSLDESTDAIMEELEDPERQGPWDRRGL